MTRKTGAIRVGIGGWDYDPWRGPFYPHGLARTRQLHHASRRLTAIEVNATFYKLQSPTLFARWAETVPPGFVFTLKASRFATNRRDLAAAGDAVARFVGQGLSALGGKLGPILWQLAATKPFDPDEIAAFLALLPRTVDGVPLRHAIEAGHESFRDPRFAALARAAGVAVCLVDRDGDRGGEPDPAGPFVYARLKAAREMEPAGYPAPEIEAWARRAAAWADAGRDVYLFAINGAKVRAPAAAEALIAAIEKAAGR